MRHLGFRMLVAAGLVATMLTPATAAALPVDATLTRTTQPASVRCS